MTLWPVSSRTIRTGDEVLVSTPKSVASLVINPGIFRSNSIKPDCIAAMTKGGRTSFSSACLTPGRKLVLPTGPPFFSRQEIGQPLHRCAIVSASGEKSLLLPMPPEGKTRQRTFTPQVLPPHIDHHGAVGVRAVPSKTAHPVRDDAARQGAAPDHPAAGTHAEGIDGTIRRFHFCP